MFVRIKRAGGHDYLQIVENHREAGRSVQRVVASLGRLDRLQADGQVDALLRSLARFADHVRIVEDHRAGRLEARAARQLGPDLVFGRLWRELGLPQILERLLQDHRFGFPVERAVYLSVLHRLFAPGSDRAADRWRRDVTIPGADGLALHQLYRAMRWLGEHREAIEERLFTRHRDVLTEVTLAFFDTTTLTFEGRGGQSLGRRGHNKDGHPELPQMVVGAVLTGEGRPVACEMWPGNTADVTVLQPVVERVRQRFGLQRVCWVADRGMVSAATLRVLEERGLGYIVGMRMRGCREVAEEVLSRAGRYREVAENLRVKEVWVEDRRYVICHNPEEAAKDAADREAILCGLEEALGQGGKALVGNRGYRRFLRVERGALAIDREKVEADARLDGKFVLRTNTRLPAEEVALQYKRLLLVERFFREMKGELRTRPIYHHWDDTIRGHVFVSFLALVLRDELRRRLEAKGLQVGWAEVKQDLEALQEVEVRDGESWYLLRTALQGVAGKVLQAVGVAPPPSVRPLPVVPSQAPGTAVP